MKRGSIFETDGIPRIQEALPLALQHVVAMIVGCVTPAIIVAGAVGGGGLSDKDRVILIQAFNTGLIMVNVSTFWQYVARGALLLFALTSDFIRKQKREKELLEASMRNVK